MRVTVFEQDLGSQETLIRSLNQRSLIPVPEVMLPEFDSFFKEEIEVSTRASFTSEVVKEKLTILDPKRQIKCALNEDKFIVLLPLRMLPFNSVFMPKDITEGSPVKILYPSGIDGDTGIKHTPWLPMPNNTWLIFVIGKRGSTQHMLEQLYLETHVGNTVYVPHMQNLFENGNVCLGTMQAPKIEDRRSHTMRMFKDFLASFWNNHLMTDTASHWLRWDLDFNYVYPSAPMNRWCYTAGSPFSVFAK